MTPTNYRSRRANIWLYLTSRGNGGRQELWMGEKAVRILSLCVCSFDDILFSCTFKLLAITNLTMRWWNDACFFFFLFFRLFLSSLYTRIDVPKAFNFVLAISLSLSTSFFRTWPDIDMTWYPLLWFIYDAKKMFFFGPVRFIIKTFAFQMGSIFYFCYRL